ncbi:MAG: anthranilate phosphoribosyltransferase [Candidatus Omnitrophota bacterium]
MDIKQAIQKLICGEDLTENQMRAVFNVIMSGRATSAQIAAFITALRMKGATVGEITGAAKVMREKAVKVRVKKNDVMLDMCGTGGSGIPTFNISTTAAFVLAGCGVKVAKHGNRAASGRCGSADVLEELGVKLDVSRAVTEKCIREIGIGFMYAPLFHGAMKHAAAARKEVGIRTIFNILGPLANPAGARRQVLGVCGAGLTLKLAKVLKALGSVHAYIVHGKDGLDEVTISGETQISELKNGKIRTYSVTPEKFGFKRKNLKSIRGASARENAALMRKVLSGKKGPARDIVLINSSVGLMAAGKAATFKEGVRMAAEAVDSGAAGEKLKGLIRITNRQMRRTPAKGARKCCQK